MVLAHRMAVESPMAESEMIEAMEFPEISDQFNVGGVPQTTINAGAGVLVGAGPEEYLVVEIMKVIYNAS